jgi:3-(3-hydroxy-phenyl)propionate hydroxylase
MPLDDQSRRFPYVRSPDQRGGPVAHHAVIVVGAGPVGLTCAIDLARQGVRVVLLDDDDTVSTGSRAISFAKRTLEIWDRLQCGDRMVDKGISWSMGKVFFQESEVYRFSLQEQVGHHRPAFVNIQQYYVEGFLHDIAAAEPNIDLRSRNKVVSAVQDGVRVTLEVETPDGVYPLTCDYLVACDGARSPIRGMLGLESKGQSFRDRFLIADVKLQPAVAERFTSERWFWFDPPFHRGQSVLLHQQPDHVWRIDFQLGWDADVIAEREPERVAARVRALLGEDATFEFQWISIYTFACVRMERFRHDRVIFAGDAAHGVSPFGGRGANSGIQDVDNLAWKLRMVLRDLAPSRLLDSYDDERVMAADENILNSTRSTDFITPKNEASKRFRDAVLTLSRCHPFARTLVNSGRLSQPTALAGSPLNTADVDAFAGAMAPGAACVDAPIVVEGGDAWLIDQLGREFTLLSFVSAATFEACVDEHANLRASSAVPLRSVVVLIGAGRAAGQSIPAWMVGAADRAELAAQRYDATDGTVYLVRPDQHVCGRWRRFDRLAILDALAMATCAVAPEAREASRCLSRAMV